VHHCQRNESSLSRIKGRHSPVTATSERQTERGYPITYPVLWGFFFEPLSLSFPMAYYAQDSAQFVAWKQVLVSLSLLGSRGRAPARARASPALSSIHHPSSIIIGTKDDDD
jgi:hypothetical protein